MTNVFTKGSVLVQIVWKSFNWYLQLFKTILMNNNYLFSIGSLKHCIVMVLWSFTINSCDQLLKPKLKEQSLQDLLWKPKGVAILGHWQDRISFQRGNFQLFNCLSYSSCLWIVHGSATACKTAHIKLIVITNLRPYFECEKYISTVDFLFGMYKSKR